MWVRILLATLLIAAASAARPVGAGDALEVNAGLRKTNGDDRENEDQTSNYDGTSEDRSMYEYVQDREATRGVSPSAFFNNIFAKFGFVQRSRGSDRSGTPDVDEDVDDDVLTSLEEAEVRTTVH